MAFGQPSKNRRRSEGRGKMERIFRQSSKEPSLPTFCINGIRQSRSLTLVGETVSGLRMPSLGCFSFGPEHIQSPDIWSPTIGPEEQTVPAHLVPMHKWSPRQLVPKNKQSRLIWSPWTNGPQDNWSPWTIGPQNLLVYSKCGLKHFFQFFDILWSTFDITDDFKPISKMFFSCFGEIKQLFLFSSNIIL